MLKIKKLSKEIRSKISSGEIIRRPSCVLKELLENSLDADSSTIRISFFKGGKKKLKIIDDGLGIPSKYLKKSIKNGTTSKIKFFSDLLKIKTLGFRGEALSSISSVSNIKITSREFSSNIGYSIENYKKNLNFCIKAHPIGTTVEVKKLFYNISLRKNLLNTDNIEKYYLVKVFKRIVLGFFKKRFILNDKYKNIYDLKSSFSIKEKEERIQELIGKDFLKISKFIKKSYKEIKFFGWIGKTNKLSRVKYIYINNRFVENKLIKNLIKQFFKSLDKNCNPVYMLYIQIPSKYININVSPTKNKIEFFNPKFIYNFFINLLNKNFRSINKIKSIEYKKCKKHKNKKNDKKIIGIIHNHFLLIKFNKGLYILNLISFFEEKYYKMIKNEYKKNKIKRISLLIPQFLEGDFDHKLLKKYGFVITQIAFKKWVINEVPSIIKGINYVKLIKKINFKMKSDSVLKLISFYSKKYFDYKKVNINKINYKSKYIKCIKLFA